MNLPPAGPWAMSQVTNYISMLAKDVPPTIQLERMVGLERMALDPHEDFHLTPDALQHLQTERINLQQEIFHHGG